MGWPKPSHVSSQTCGLEEELHSKFHYPAALFDGGLAKVLVGLRKRSSARILNEIESQVPGIREGIQRVVEEVVSIDPELQALGFADLEVLKDRHVPVKVRWTV